MFVSAVFTGVLIAGITQVPHSSREFKRAAGAKPYASLFQVRPSEPVTPSSMLVPRATRPADQCSPPMIERGPCGVPVIVARPELDPDMVRPVPEPDRKTAKIRTFEPRCAGG